MSKDISKHSQTRLVLVALQDYTRKQGYPPSIADLMRLTGKARSTVAYHLDRLERWGWIRHEAGLDRTWQAVNQVIEDDSESEAPVVR